MINILFSKKGFLIGGILLFLLLLIFSFFFLQSSKSRGQVGSSIPIASTETSPNSFTKNKTTGVLTENLNTYTTADYVIKYPPDWKTEGSATMEGPVVLLYPATLSSGDSYPGLFIYTIDKPAASFGQRETMYTQRGYIKTTQIVDGKEAIKLQAKLPFKVANGKAIQGTVQETNLLVQGKNKYYLFKYHYLSETIDKKMEDTFMQIISSFHTS